MTLNVVLPIAGRGERFARCGYDMAKPFVPVLGKPMIQRVVEALGLSPEDHLLVIHHESLAQEELSALLRQTLPGAPVTLHSLERYTGGAAETVLLGLESLPDALLARPSIVVDGDGLFDATMLGNFRKAPGNTIFCVHDDGDEPVFSYVGIDDDWNVNQIVEKQKISSLACTGAYGFSSGAMLRDSAAQIVTAGDRRQGEYYMSQIVQHLVDEGLPVRAALVDKWACIGTPEQLVTWCRRQILLSQIGRSELASEASGLPSPPKDAEADEANERASGYYLPKAIASRPWHSIEIGEDRITKSGPSESVAHEGLWYSNLPPALAAHAPRLISQRHDGETTHLELERVFGALYSHLLFDDLLGERDIAKLLDILTAFHESEHGHRIGLPDGATIYDNYDPKLAARRDAILTLPEANSSYETIVAWHRAYEDDNRGRRALIHGDPVFTNIFLTPAGSIVFVDPRGHLNGRSSLIGDANYDLAKVYQSLVGYDAVLLGATSSNATAILRDAFEDWVIGHFGPEALDDIRWITAGLFLSLLPLHEARHRGPFLRLCQELIGAGQ